MHTEIEKSYMQCNVQYAVVTVQDGGEVGWFGSHDNDIMYLPKLKKYHSTLRAITAHDMKWKGKGRITKQKSNQQMESQFVLTPAFPIATVATCPYFLMSTSSCITFSPIAILDLGEYLGIFWIFVK